MDLDFIHGQRDIIAKLQKSRLERIHLDILTLKMSNKHCSSRHFKFLLLSFEENKA